MRMWIRLLVQSLAWLSMMTWLVATLPARAQDSDAKEHFRRGEAAYQQGNYALAIEEWQAAFTQDPRPRIQYNLYQAYERLGKLSEASDALQRYLSTADPDDPNYSDATARMAALQQRLQATGVRIIGGVEGASINVSGHDWGRLPRPDRIPVQPGNHRIIISLEGYEDFVSNVVVPAGQVVDIPVQLERKTDATAPPDEADEGGSASGSVNLRAGGTPSDAGDDATPFYIASAALGVGAIGSGIWMFNRIGELDGCDDPDFFCAEEDAVSTQRTIAIATTAVLGVGAIGVLVYGLILDSNTGGETRATLPACMPALTGASCTLRF